MFYYPTNSGNKAYKAIKEFKKLSLLSPLSKGITFNIGCSDYGSITADFENCTIALYLIKLYAGRREIKSILVLVGVTEDNRMLSHSECEDILNCPVYSFEEHGDRKPYWLKSGKFDKMDGLVNLDEYVKCEEEKLTPLQHEEIDRMNLAAANKKNALLHSLDDIELDMKQAEKEKESVRSDRLKLLMIERKISVLKNELSKKKEGLFFDEMQIDVDLEKQINEFLGREKITAKAERQFVMEVINHE